MRALSNGVIDVDDALRRLSATLTQERFTGPEWIFEGKLDGIYRGISEAVADKGYHSNQVMVDLEAVGVRSYISEPDRGQRNWKDNSEARGAVRSPCQTPCET